MSRSGYSEDYDGDESINLYRGSVERAMRGKRGQRFFVDLVKALDAMDEKRLIVGLLETDSGEVCALGALGRLRGIDLPALDENEDIAPVASKFDIAESLARETVYENDEVGIGRLVEKVCPVCHGWGEHVSPAVSRFSNVGRSIRNCNNCRGRGRLYKRHRETPEQRWTRIRAWAVSHIKTETEVQTKKENAQ